jgi:hypothetical protein
MRSILIGDHSQQLVVGAHLASEHAERIWPIVQVRLVNLLQRDGSNNRMVGFRR